MLPILAGLAEVGVLIARAAPIIARSAWIENKLNPIGLAVAGAIGYEINSRNQDKADARQAELMAELKAERADHKKQMADLVDAVSMGNMQLSAKMNAVAAGVDNTNARLAGMNGDMKESAAVLMQIMKDVKKTSDKIGMCTSASTLASAPQPVFH